LWCCMGTAMCTEWVIFLQCALTKKQPVGVCRWQRCDTSNSNGQALFVIAPSHLVSFVQQPPPRAPHLEDAAVWIAAAWWHDLLLLLQLSLIMLVQRAPDSSTAAVFMIAAAWCCAHNCGVDLSPPPPSGCSLVQPIV
jgi:hypothetical protein